MNQQPQNLYRDHFLHLLINVLMLTPKYIQNISDSRFGLPIILNKGMGVTEFFEYFFVNYNLFRNNGVQKNITV